MPLMKGFLQFISYNMHFYQFRTPGGRIGMLPVVPLLCHVPPVQHNKVHHMTTQRGYLQELYPETEASPSKEF